MSAWWLGATIYQIYPRSFRDSNADGIGDLDGIIDGLDYVANLGVDAIWISPFFKSPMCDFGYDVEDYYDVDPVFGTIEGFRRLVDAAHARGLKVIIDQVYSHSSDQCRWFKESRSSRDNDKADWYVWADAADDGGLPNNWQSEFGGAAWSWGETRQQFYLHNFLKEQPDLNLHCDAVREEIDRVMRFWLDIGVDGFRFDAVNHFLHDPEFRNDPGRSDSHPLTGQVIEQLRRTLDEYGGRFSVAEVGGDHSFRDMVDYTLSKQRFDTAYSFAYLDKKTVSPLQIRDVQESWEEASDAWPSVTFGNHDSPRLATRLANGADREQFAHLMHAILFSLKGIVFLYQGDELGLPQSDVPFAHLRDPEGIRNWPDGLGRDGARTPMPWSTSESNAGWIADSWLPVEPSHLSLSVETQSSRDDSVLNRCRRLIAMRKQLPALLFGEINFLPCSDAILAFERIHEGQTLLCVFNMGNKPATLSADVGGLSPTTELIYETDEGTARSACLPPFSGFIARRSML